jgi:hypothetical protein
VDPSNLFCSGNARHGLFRLLGMTKKKKKKKKEPLFPPRPFTLRLLPLAYSVSHFYSSRLSDPTTTDTKNFPMKTHIFNLFIAKNTKRLLTKVFDLLHSFLSCIFNLQRPAQDFLGSTTIQQRLRLLMSKKNLSPCLLFAL